MVSSKLFDLENAINNLSLEEKIWLMEKIVAQMKNQTKSTNYQSQVDLESRYENTNLETEPLIGLFAASPDLATNSEEILQGEIREKSGGSYKEISP
ncbi:hypothetical protein [Dapis sp. BLCC M229]|uniref:hypothetical protein n=1 Tax=Dapis sp. BLCC M229 TaxID=3400188 RepID=UPI003CF3219C